MIKYDTLPDIYDKEAKREKKRAKRLKNNDYLVHTNTTNPSFLKMYRNLAALKIENNDFFLALYDERLEDIDPFDPDLTPEEQLMVFKECCVNYWYFVREIVRIPVTGGTKKYHLHRGNLALSWCLLNNLNFFLELPRQNFKSVSIDIALLWLYNFHTSNSSMLIMNKEHSDAKENLARIREIRDELPEYLRFDTRFTEDGRELKLLENKQDAFNPKNNNKLITKPSATSKDKADKLGRGMTQAVQWYDEFAFLKYNMIIYESASPAARQAGEEAESKGKPHCKMISTTPGDLNTEYGLDAYNFKNKCCMFKEEYYDWDIDDVKEIIRVNSDNGFFNIIFSWQQLGRNRQYFEQCRIDLAGNWMKIKREVELRWAVSGDDGPFDAADLEKLADITYTEEKVANPVYIDKYYLLNLYEKIDHNVTTIVSCDVASGSSRDYSTITLINSKTKRCIGEFNNNKVDTLAFSYIIHAIATKICPNCVICIERNNVGAAVITNLLRTDVKNKLYYELKEDELQDRVKKGRTVGTEISVTNYGVWTDDTKREQMFEILSKFVKNYRERIRTPILSSQIQALIYNKHGRIDHPYDGHDDVVMGFLVGMWVYYYGKNLNKFGIIRMPDVDPATGMTEEEALAKELFKEADKREATERAINNALNNGEDDSFSNIFGNSQFKTMKDFYDEIDREKERYFDQQESPISSTFNLESVLGANRVNRGSGTIDLLHDNDDNQSGYGNSVIDSMLSDTF